MTERNPDFLQHDELLTANLLRNGLLAGLAVAGALAVGAAEAEPTIAAQVPAKVKPSHHNPATGVGPSHAVYHPMKGVGQAHEAH